MRDDDGEWREALNRSAELESIRQQRRDLADGLSPLRPGCEDWHYPPGWCDVER